VAIPSRTWNGTRWPEESTITRIALLDGPAPMCFAAFASLAEEDGPDVEAALVLRLGSPDWRRRRAACEALGARARSRATLHAVAALLDDDSTYVVAASCRAVGRLGAVDLRDRIARLLEGADEEIRLAAVEALDAFGEGDAFDVLFRAMCTDASETVQRRAAFALHDHSSITTWRTLFERWRTDTLARHRVWACDLAARFGDTTTCEPTLLALSEDRDGHVRSAAAVALARIRGRNG
jgi:HEAT repeat protein